MTLVSPRWGGWWGGIEVPLVLGVAHGLSPGGDTVMGVGLGGVGGDTVCPQEVTQNGSGSGRCGGGHSLSPGGDTVTAVGLGGVGGGGDTQFVPWG